MAQAPTPNTGKKGYTTLVQYNLYTGEKTGVTKPNESGDPDYIPPVTDLELCPEYFELYFLTNSIEVSSDGQYVFTQLISNTEWQVMYQADSATVTGSNIDSGSKSLKLKINKNFEAREVKSRITIETTTPPILRAILIVTQEANELTNLHIGTGYDTPSEAGADSTIDNRLFHSGYNDIPDRLDKVFTQATNGSMFNGNNKWFGIINSDYAINISVNGIIMEVVDTSQSLSVSPSSKTVPYSSGSFIVTVNSDTNWVIVTSSWMSATKQQGSGNDTFTVNYTDNTDTTNDRNDDVLVRTSDDYIRKEVAIKQYSAPIQSNYESHPCSTGSSSEAACSNWSNSGNRSEYYTDNQAFRDSTVIYLDPEGTTYASSGYYSNGFDWIHWDKSNENVTNSGLCNSGFPY